jgi:ATP adenylyltransferase
MTMDKIWAPWREKYVKMKAQKGCIFCQRSAKNSYPIGRSKHSFSMLNIFPYNTGHIMVAPKKHVKDLGLLNDEELLDLMKHLNKIKTILQKELKPHGFNIGINLGKCAGAGFKDHVHIHIVPRWRGDTNFMPVVSSTKVLPESLKSLQKKLKAQYF